MTKMLIQVKVRDISFDQLAAEHGRVAEEMNQRYRDQWERMRGQFVTIVTPHLPFPKQDCIAHGRVWLTKGTLWGSMCEHQIEVGD
jgi:hypothetical protein